MVSDNCVKSAEPKLRGSLLSAVQSIEDLPDHVSPELFGLHPNVDLTFRRLQVQGAIQVILDTRPLGPTIDGGNSIEDTVDALCEELLNKARLSL